ncbi:hypothetical protein BpHYR1_049685, partial [Brachionus plicatilis]
IFSYHIFWSNILNRLAPFSSSFISDPESQTISQNLQYRGLKSSMCCYDTVNSQYFTEEKKISKSKNLKKFSFKKKIMQIYIFGFNILFLVLIGHKLQLAR